ncbi:tubulin nucleotide-binding domain-like protein [Trametes coccinea BRFM310]|uniref:Tubulin nucleotide-binding domain-like protein n=1 Tax=Trametes coccinea (strain BRFM310) TaxID=1353009 RepID=A0A1Y2IRA8_TRAC3|nr:tubulin nucleotide-binding domain-like protein [Trametes coccinea BRFM310]
MKEILYIQAGPFANFIGQHFWNTQESYFTYAEGEDPIVFHDRSFREGLNHRGEPTFCPRVLIFDRKSHFGALSDELYAGQDDADTSQWDGGMVQYRQDPIPKSDYHTRLNEELAESDEHQGNKQTPVTVDASNVRFWSDYSRVYYHPRSIQKLPDLADWERSEGEWQSSREAFANHEHDREIMENEVRLFAEECDALQGIQLTSDCNTFGGFTDAFFAAFRDEYPKLPSLTFPLLSNASNLPVTAEEEQNAAKLINDALCMRSLEAVSTINVPLQHPSTWKRAEWLDGLNIDLRSSYHTSALLATHIESLTLPFRLKSSPHDILSLSSLLNASGTLSISHLSGFYPVPPTVTWSRDTEKRLYDLSAAREGNAPNSQARVTEYARMQVSRGFNSAEYEKYDEYFSDKSPAPFSIHAPPYPTPSSFPPLFASSDPVEKQRCLSSLSTSTATARLFASYATLVQECIDRRADVATRMGLEFDELRELKDDLWALCDRYAGPDEEWRGQEEEVLSEDEE